MEVKKEIQVLFDKANSLNGKQLLHTTFGPDTYFTIGKMGKEFLIQAFRNKWSFQKEGKELTTSKFKTAEELNAHILCITWAEHYARNVFSGNLTHMDNWVNFVKAFKVSMLEYVNNGGPTQDWYFYKSIEKNLVESK